MTSLSLSKSTNDSPPSLRHNTSRSVMVVLVALEGRKIKHNQDWLRTCWRSASAPHESKRRQWVGETVWVRGRERGKENPGLLAGRRREIAVLMGVRCMSVGFGGVLRKLKQTQVEEHADIRATRERDRWRSEGMWVTFQGCNPVNDETSECVQCSIRYIGLIQTFILFIT